MLLTNSAYEYFFKGASPIARKHAVTASLNHRSSVGAFNTQVQVAHRPFLNHVLHVAVSTQLLTRRAEDSHQRRGTEEIFKTYHHINVIDAPGEARAWRGW